MVDAVKSVVAIENVAAAINQIPQTTLRKVVGQHTLDETLAETDRINRVIREILDVATETWGVVVTLVEIGVDKNTMVVIPAPLTSTIHELTGFLTRETSAAPAPVAIPAATPDDGPNGKPLSQVR